MKNIISYLGFNQVTRSRYSRLDSLSLVSRQSVLAIIVVFLTAFSGNAWGTSVEFVAGTSSGQFNQTDTVTSSPVTVITNATGSDASSRQIWKSGSTAKKETAIQLSSGADSDPTTKYVEIKVAAGYKITGFTVRGAVAGSSTFDCPVYCWAKSFRTTADTVIGTGSLAFPNYNGSSDGANVTMTGLVSGTRTLRFYKRVKYNSSTHTIGDGSNNPGTGQTLNIAKITVTYEALPTYSVTYKANGGTGADVNHTIAYAESNATVGFTAPGHKVLAGWNTEADGSGTPYEIEDVVTANVTLYAQWEMPTDLYIWESKASYGGASLCVSSIEASGSVNVNASPKALANSTLTTTGLSYMGRPSSNGTVCTLTFTVDDGLYISSICTYGKFEETAGGEYSWDGGTNWTSQAKYTSQAKKVFSAPDATYPSTFMFRFTGASTETGGLWWRNALITYEDVPDEGCSAYEFHYGTHDGSDWETACFEQVGETNEWKIEDFTIPSTPNYYVGYHGDGEGGWNSTWSSERAWTDWPTKSDNKWQGQIFLTPNDGALGSFAVGQATGATGTLTIHSDYNDYNKFLSFTPDGYGITYSGSGHAFAETATSNMYETDVVTLPNCTTTYNIGLKTATAGTYVKSIHSKTTDEALSAMGVTIKNGGKKIIYLVPGSFNSAGAVYAVWDCSYNSGAGQWGDGTTKLFTDVDEDGIYECPVDANCANIILVRLSSGTDASNISWDRKWNQTSGSSTISVGDLLQKYEITSLDGDNCSYSTTAMHPTTGEKGKFRMWANSASSNWYVHWIPYYVLSYDANGGTGTTAQTERNTESSTTTVTVASNGFTAPTGYEFAGWATSQSHADAGTVDYAAGADYTLTSNATLYAVWTPATYTITLDKGTQGAANQSATVAYNATAVTSITHVSATGYDLTGYFDGSTKVLNANGSFADDDVDGYITDGKWSKTDDCTLTAKWTPQVYDIIYLDQDDEEFSGYHIEGYPTTHTYGAGNTTLKKAVKQGYKFGGWWTVSDCASGNKTVLNSKDYTDDITLYAKWTAVTFVGLTSGTFYGASAMVPDGVTVGSEQYYPGVTSDQKFNLVGVGTSNADGGPMSSKGGLSSQALTNADAVTECMYFKKVATVTSYVPTDHAIQFKIPSPGGQLEVWANDDIYLSDGSSETLVDISSNYAVVKGLAAGTYYLYAKNTSRTLWGIRYKKTHNVNAVTSTGKDTYGTVSADPTTVAEDSTSTITAVPATGYQVTNWAVSGSGSPSISPSGASNSNTTTLTMSTANATVTVTFGAIDYTITHGSPTGDGTYTIQVASGDPTGSSTTANYGQTITLAATPGDGYELSSWTVTGATSGDAITVTSNQFTMPAENVTVTATFVIPCTAVAAPTSLTCSAQTPNTLTYTWSAASNASGYTATLYPDEDCEETPVSTQVLSDVTTVTFTSLTASTTYYCKVQSNGDGSTYCENGGTTSAQSGTTTAPRIIYNANLDGTSGSTTDGTSTEGAKACGYSKSGYKFKWWNTAANGSGEDFYVGESVTLGGSDVNLYAQWEEVGSGWAYWVGDVAISSASTAYDVTGNGVTMQITRESSADWNTGLTDNWTIVSKYDGTTSRHAKVLAVDADNSYIEINFKDGSTINDLYLGITSDQTDAQNFVVCYSTTADFSSGAYEFVKVGSTDNVVSVPGHDQATKSTTRVKPSTADKYKYVRIYRKLTDGTGYNDTEADLGCSNKARIYSIKAQKGTASYTVTYADGGADDGDVPEDNTEYAEGAEVTVLGNTGSLAKTEHTFGGWSDGVNTYDAGDKFDMPASDVTLTAVWIINQYNVAVASVDHVTITATPAGGLAISEGNNANVDYGKSVTLAYSSLESGNYWGGWKVTKNSDGSDVTASVVDGNTLTVPAYAVTVSAVTYGDLVVWCDPDITITGDIHLTSVNGVSVYATSTTSNLIRIQSNDLAGVNKLGIKYLDADDNVITGSDRLFRLCDDGTPNYNVVDSKDTAVSTTCDLYFSISYTPNAYDQLDYCKLQIEMKRTGGRPNKVVTHDLYGRSLPEEFVVASKSNDGQWYALPNTLEATESASKAVAGVRITVDNTTTPTAATYAPNIAVYRGEGRNNSAANRYGIRLTDGTNHLQVSTTGSNNKMWLSPTGSVNCQDWWLSSTNFGAYSVTIPSNTGNESKKIGMSGGNIGYYTSPTSPSGQIYFLPITNKYTDIPATATEWGQYSVILAANPGATATKAQARIEGGSPTEDQTISAINAAMGTAKNVKVSVGDIDLADLANNEGKLLYIDWYNSSSTLLGTSAVTIPRIIAASRNMKTDGEPLKNAWTDKEVHVLPGITLTANTSDYASSPGTATIKELHIYPGATLNVSTGKLTATTLRLHNGWTRAGATKQYNTARVYINATNHAALAKGTASMDYDIYELTDGKHYYPLAVPFETAVSSIDYADSYLAGFSTYGTHYGIKAYNGARRAEQGPDQANNWSLVAGDATLAPGKGYIMTAVAVNGEAIIRIPLTYNDAWTADGEKGTASYGEPAAEHTKNVVAVEAYTGTAATANKSNAGWNLLGVPFMSCYATNMENMIGEEETTFINGRLILTGDPSSPLAFDDTDKNIYVNVPTHDFSEYLQTVIDETTLLPGWCFMVQIGTGGNLTFLTSAQAESSSTPIYAPRRTAEEERVLRTGIVLSDAEKSDKTTILVSQRYNEEYEIGADLEKMFGDGYTLATYSLSNNTRLAYNAMSPTNAENVIPIGYRAPADGEYTFSINPRYAENGAFQRVDLIDYQKGTLTNLLNVSYTFSTARTQNDSRFALNIVPKKQPEITTAMDEVQSDDVQGKTYKVIIHDKMYIILDGKMYDATGKVVKGGQK